LSICLIWINLERPPDRVRHGTDAVLRIDGHTIEFELKSVTTDSGSIGTARDFGPDHIAKWKDKHWLIGVYRRDALEHCKYGSPAAMALWIEAKWEYMKADFELARHVPAAIPMEMLETILGSKDRYSAADAKKLHKDQYSAKQYRELMDLTEIGPEGKVIGIGYTPVRMLEILRDRARYVIQRGSTLNNPHISNAYLENWERISTNHAIRLRELVREWLKANQPQARVPLQAQHDNP
jgi:hypothetical protein